MTANTYIVVELEEKDRERVKNAIDVMHEIKECVAKCTVTNYCEPFEETVNLLELILENGGMF